MLLYVINYSPGQASGNSWLLPESKNGLRVYEWKMDQMGRSSRAPSCGAPLSRLQDAWGKGSKVEQARNKMSKK